MATKIIRNGRILGGTSKIQNDETRHMVSRNFATLPKVKLENGRIITYTLDAEGHETTENVPEVSAVKKEYVVVVNNDGTIAIDGAEGGENGLPLICLGDQWDHFVTVLHFDLSALNWKESDYTNYLFRIAFVDAKGSNVKIQSINDVENYFYLGADGYTYEFDGKDFLVPDELTETATTYNIILFIQEKIEDEEEGNTTAGIERFVTDQWQGYIRENFFSPDMPLDAISYFNRDVALSKEPIEAILADDGTFALTTADLGNSFDAYIRTIKATNITAHLNEFEVFALFNKDKKVYAAKFDRNEGKLIDMFIPSGVCNDAGVWDMMLVAYKGDIDNPDYFYCSTIFHVEIESNFLKDASFDTNSGLVGSLSTTNGYSNFVDRNGNTFETANGNTFFYDEE